MTLPSKTKSSPLATDAHDIHAQCPLTRASISSIEQGVWTVISYFAEMELKGALKVAKCMRCSILSIHELDWERLETCFGNKGKFLQRYSNTTIAEKAQLTAIALVDAFIESVGIQNRNLITSSHEDRIFRIGMVVGAAAALGEVYKIDANAANEISGIVSAPIALDPSLLLKDIATFR